jgi:hypothetical protein
VNNNLREAIYLTVLGAVLVVLGYVVADFMIRAIPKPFGTLEDFSFMWSFCYG